MILAVIDMGTNTFNLLVAQTDGPILYESKLPVKLGEGGFTQKTITTQAMERAFSAISLHLDKAKELGAEKIFAFATSMVRDSINGADFTRLVKQKFSIDVDVISGRREAELIFKGVRSALTLNSEPNLVVDIGGGSNETIIADANQIFWLESFKLGVTRIMEHFRISDPITKQELQALEQYMLKVLEPLWAAAERFRPTLMAGSSGSFDSFRKILVQKKVIAQNALPWAEIPVEEYLQLHNFFISSNHAERLTLQGLDPIRIDLIVPASIFVNLLVQKMGIRKMFQSDYSLKEGFLAELIQ